MRARTLLPLAALAATSCLVIDNTPFRYGAVSGQVAGADPSVGLAVVVGDAKLRSQLDSDGGFFIPDVPVGDQTLLIVATSTTALEVPAHVDPGQTTELDLLTPGPAAFATVTVVAAGAPDLTLAQIGVEGTQFEEIHPDARGTARVGPLGAGCYDVKAELSDFGSSGEHICVSAGEERSVSLQLSLPDAGEGKIGAEACDECPAGTECVPADGGAASCRPG